MQNKKILIISHNPLSKVNNNGKTLVSIFKGVPSDNIYQLYLNADVPDYNENCHYVQLNEHQILSSFLHRNNVCCQQIKPDAEKISSANIKTSSFGIHTKRLLREAVWKTGVWKSALKKWLSDKSFDIIFCMAGDGLFAYDIYSFVLEHTNAKGCLFFTDDYILGKTSNSPIAILRRNLLKQKIRKTLPLTKDLYVISEEMKEAYSKLFNKEGFVIRNFSVEKTNNSVNCNGDNKENLSIVYAGGLHYNRWKVLSKVASAIKEINEDSSIKCLLKIYSAQHISDDIISQTVIEGASVFCGGASAEEIANIYASADILLHVESSDKKAVASTKYSFSTKIPEYLSAGKCVLAIGPSELASIKYLIDVACVVSDETELKSKLKNIILDTEYRNIIKTNCEKQFEKDFSDKKQTECLKHILSIP